MFADAWDAVISDPSLSYYYGVPIQVVPPLSVLIFFLNPSLRMPEEFHYDLTFTRIHMLRSRCMLPVRPPRPATNTDSQVGIF